MNKCPSTVSFWLSYERELSYMDLSSLTYLILIIEVINLCLKSWIKCIFLAFPSQFGSVLEVILLSCVHICEGWDISAVVYL